MYDVHSLRPVGCTEDRSRISSDNVDIFFNIISNVD